MIKLNISSTDKLDGYINILSDNEEELSQVDDGEAQEIRVYFALSLIPLFRLDHYLKALVKKLAVGGKLIVVDLDYWRLSDAYYWERIDIIEVNKHLVGCKSFIDSEVVRQNIPFCLVRSKIDGYNFLLEFKRER